MRTLHLISHTHWDREWYLTYQQFRLKLVDLIDNLLDILDADPHYRHFMLDGQTIVLEDYLQVRPEREADLRRYIEEGRILIGPWYILPDEFLVSAEAHIRNLLEGDRVARRFGPKMPVGYLPDTFGHIGQMPQILRGFGLGTAAVWRGVTDMPCEILWEAPDGSRVLTANLRESYSNAAGIMGAGPAGMGAQAAALRDTLAPHAASSHLLLMFGTDHMPPQAETSAGVRAAALGSEALDSEALGSEALGSDALVHSTLPDYFQAVRAELDTAALPVVCGELRDCMRQYLLPGVLSTRMWIKQRNQQCETLLEKWAEPFSAWAEMAGKPGPGRLRRPSAALREAWRLLIQCHPHDSICGCSIDPVHEEMRPRFDQVEQVGEEITRQSLEALAASTNTLPEGEGDAASAVIVYNPTGGPRTDTVSVEIDTLPKTGSFALVDAAGVEIPFQHLGTSSSEMMNVAFDRATFREGLRAVVDGVFSGMRIQEMRVQREGAQVSLDVTVRAQGTANIPAWEAARAELEALLEDPAVTVYHVHARSAEAVRVLFSAPEVPGYGYRTFWVRAKESAPAEVLPVSPLARSLMPLAAKVASSPAGQRLIAAFQTEPASKPPYIIENEFFTVEALPDGTLEVLDKTSGLRWNGLNRFVDGGDRGDEYNYSAPARDRLKTAVLKSARVIRGAVEQVLELTLELIVPETLNAQRTERSTRLKTLPLTSRVRLTAGTPRVEIHSEVENRARDHRLRVHFAAPFAVDAADYDGHFEIVRRPVDLPVTDARWQEQPYPQVPQRAFTLVEHGSGGLLIANRGLPEVEVLRAASGGSEIALTLLRCVGWLSRSDYPERSNHAGPGFETPAAQMPGRWAFDYAIVPFGAGGRDAAIEQARAFEAPMRAVSATLHKGPLAAQGSFLTVGPAQFALSAVKTAADGQGWLARGYNPSGEALEVSLKPMVPYTKAWRATLAEEKIEEVAPEKIRVRGHEVVTVRFE